jgi:hypothetical protein
VRLLEKLVPFVSLSSRYTAQKMPRWNEGSALMR